MSQLIYEKQKLQQPVNTSERYLKLWEKKRSTVNKYMKLVYFSFGSTDQVNLTFGLVTPLHQFSFYLFSCVCVDVVFVFGSVL